MLRFAIDRKNTRPLFQQIVERIAGMIDEGVLKPGDHLPASRKLADDLGINRSTVVRAYQELWSLGYIETRPGGYSTVRSRIHPVSQPVSEEGGVFDWDHMGVDVPGEPAGPQLQVTGECIDFGRLVPDERLYPADDFRRSLNRAMRREGTKLLGYGDPLGYPGLRRYVAQRMRLHGVTVSPDQIMLTSGSQNAIELIVKLLVTDGVPVAVESPTYSAVLPLLRYFRIPVKGIPMTDEGADLDVLERQFESERPALFYTIPNFHNPTGITTGQAHRERLLDLARHYRVPLVEDGFEEEMKYFGRAVLPIKSMDRDGVVVYVGSFSKVLFPGIRVGWVAADDGCIRRLAAIRRATQLTGNPVIQAGLAEFCASGEYDAHIGRMHRAFRKRMQTALRLLRTQLTDTGVRWTQPAGGYTVWLQLPDGKLTESDWLDRFQKYGVRLAPGSGHFPKSPDGIYVRLSISERDEKEIRTGIERLGKAVRSAMS